MAAGSVYDGIKITKMDEFDMDIVIRLPISYEDGPNGIVLENDEPGFVKMKIENAFDNLVNQTNWEKCHKVTNSWRDSDNYFLQNKFRQWLHAIVQRAINQMKGRIVVNGVTYLLKYKESGPAYTLLIRNEKGDEDFELDVDLVPVIKFQWPRWPKGYRPAMSGSRAEEWLVVPKPNQAVEDITLKNRCWRLSFQVYEKEMMTGCQNLKMTIRLVKKLRDSLSMNHIASYYVKTVFLWKIDEVKDRKYWENRTSKLFCEMVSELHKAIEKKNIPYFWNNKLNLIAGVDPIILTKYAMLLKPVIDHMASNNINGIISSQLNSYEFIQFKSTEFYQNSHCVTSGSLSRPPSPVLEDLMKPMVEKIEKLSSTVQGLAHQVNMLEIGKHCDCKKIYPTAETPSTSGLRVRDDKAGTRGPQGNLNGFNQDFGECERFNSSGAEQLIKKSFKKTIPLIETPSLSRLPGLSWIYFNQPEALSNVDETQNSQGNFSELRVSADFDGDERVKRVKLNPKI